MDMFEAKPGTRVTVRCDNDQPYLATFVGWMNPGARVAIVAPKDWPDGQLLQVRFDQLVETNW